MCGTNCGQALEAAASDVTGRRKRVESAHLTSHRTRHFRLWSRSCRRTVASIVDEEPESPAPVAQVHQQIPVELRYLLAGRIRGDAWILTYPQVGLSVARRRMSVTTSSGSDGRPHLTGGCRRFQCTRRRCQDSSVPGVTNRRRRRADGRCRARAQSTARSAHDICGRLICRRSTATSWRRARISALGAAEDRASTIGQPSSRQKIRYSSRRPTNRDHARNVSACKAVALPRTAVKSPFRPRRHRIFSPCSARRTWSRPLWVFSRTSLNSVGAWNHCLWCCSSPPGLRIR